MYLGDTKKIKEIKIGGGLFTPSHKRSGGFRYDIVSETHSLANMEYISGGSRGTKQEWAVYRILGTKPAIYPFYVHIQNPKTDQVKKGEKFFTPYPGLYTHIHMKVGNTNINNNNYIDWIRYLHPSIKIKTLPGVNKKYRSVKRKHLPGTGGGDRSNKLTDTLYRQRPDLKFHKVNGEQWWNEFGWLELFAQLQRLGRVDVFARLRSRAKGSLSKYIELLKNWYLTAGQKEYDNIWKDFYKYYKTYGEKPGGYTRS